MKKRAAIVLLGILVCLALVVGWVRFAPDNPDRWHRMPAEIRDADRSNSALRVIGGGKTAFEKLDAIIRNTHRTRVLAGSVAENMRTYVTRTAVVGFPDYTTVRQRDGQIEIYGRARYGKSDLGVNAARIDRWLEALAQGG